MKRLFILISFITIAFLSNGQNQSINYLKDFDFLYKTIVNNSVSFKIYCEESGLDSAQLYKTLKEELKQENTMGKFAKVSHKLFNASADMHNSFVHPYFFEQTYPKLPEDEKELALTYCDTNFVETSKKNYKKYRNKLYSSIKPLHKLGAFYHDGSYYFPYDYKINNQKFKAGTEVLAINDLPVYDFYTENNLDWFPFYDQEKKQFYSNYLFTSFTFPDDKYTLTIQTSDGDKQKIVLDSTIEISQESGNFMTLINLNRVKYFRKSKTLFIRFALFGNDINFLNDIDKYADKEIERIIVDVRGNGGGSDIFWLRFLSKLKPIYNIKIPPKSIAIKHGQANEYLPPEQLIDSTSLEDYNVFNNDILEYIHPATEKLNELDASFRENFENHQNVLDYKGNIYCLADKYSFSASLCFASLKYYLPNFFLVSDNIPYYGGFGLTPLMFMLPESKLIFRITSNFDYHLYQTKQYRIAPDIKVNETLEDKLKWINKKIHYYYSKKHRLQKSKYFKAIESK